MIAPSISFDSKTTKPIWRYASLEDVQELIRNDIAELKHLHQLRAEDEAEAVIAGRRPDLTFKILIEAWERTQDVHWSWYKEIQDAHPGAAVPLEGLGNDPVDAGN